MWYVVPIFVTILDASDLLRRAKKKGSTKCKDVGCASSLPVSSIPKMHACELIIYIYTFVKIRLLCLICKKNKTGKFVCDGTPVEYWLYFKCVVRI